MIYLQAVLCRLKCLQYSPLRFLKVVEVQLCFRRLVTIQVPVHIIEQVFDLGVGDGPVRSDQVMTAFGVVVGDVSRHGKDILVVGVSNISGDQCATFLSSLYYDECITKTCDDTISSWEEVGFRFRSERSF